MKPAFLSWWPDAMPSPVACRTASLPDGCRRCYLRHTDARRSAWVGPVSIAAASSIGRRWPTVGRHRSTARPAPSPPRPISIYNSPGGRREAVPRRAAAAGSASTTTSAIRRGKRRRVFAADKVSQWLCYLFPAARRVPWPTASHRLSHRPNGCDRTRRRPRLRLV